MPIRSKEIEKLLLSLNYIARARIIVSISKQVEEEKIAKGTCYYCSIKTQKLVDDHFFPILRGSKFKHLLTYAPNIIIPACDSCNSKKGYLVFYSLNHVRRTIGRLDVEKVLTAQQLKIWKGLNHYDFKEVSKMLKKYAAGKKKGCQVL